MTAFAHGLDQGLQGRAHAGNHRRVAFSQQLVRHIADARERLAGAERHLEIIRSLRKHPCQLFG